MLNAGDVITSECVEQQTDAQEAVVDRLIKWAQRQEAVRAMLLYSSRANPDAPLDRFSDYDILLAVRDVPTFYADDSWLGSFGPVLIVFRNPLGEREGCPASLFVTHYEDGVKADFAFVATDYLIWLARQSHLPDDLDHGYRVLLDKDGLAASLPAPTFTAYRLSPPSEDTFHELIGGFFNDATYVAKSLRRGDLLLAKLCLDHVMKHQCLLQILDWHLGLKTGWTTPSKAPGKGLRQRLDPATYLELERTYVGAGEQENWEALWAIIRLFRRVTVEVGEGFGFVYLYDQDRRVMTYLEKVRDGQLP